MVGALLEKIKRDLWITHSKAENDMHYSLDHTHAEDLDINTPSRNVRTRLYFTSESHLHTLINVLRFPADGVSPAISEEGSKILESIPELSYLTHIIIRMFETESMGSEPGFRCEISFSPGAVNDPETDKSSSLSPFITISTSVSFDTMKTILDGGIQRSVTANSGGTRS